MSVLPEVPDVIHTEGHDPVTHPTRFARVLWASYRVPSTGLVVVLAMAIGFGFAGFAELFARMGALIVLAGVGFSAYCVRDIDRRVNDEVMATLLHESRDLAGEMAEARETDDHADVTSSQDIRAHVRDLNAAADRARRPFLIVELVVSVFGTLVWAFGDWAVCSASSGELNACSS